MNLLEKRTEILRIKKEIAWISSEWHEMTKNISSDYVYTHEVVRHIRVLYDYLGELVGELKSYQGELKDYYIEGVNSMATRMRLILNGASKNLTDFVSL